MYEVKTKYLPPPAIDKLPLYKCHLIEEERADATIEKYLRDIRTFYAFLEDLEVTKENVLDYKRHLIGKYKDTSTNSMISALNGFFGFCGREDLQIKQLKIQRATYLTEDKELTKADYRKLLKTARHRGEYTLSLIMQTLCMTGIRISELKDITVEGAYAGEATVASKGKRRKIFIPKALQAPLVGYIKKQDLKKGSIFLSQSGKPISRHVVWRQMKALCREAGVASSKVFPHNLRHLFARLFYALERDVVKLADVMGHASINTTRIYTAETGAAHKRMMNRMPLIC